MDAWADSLAADQRRAWDALSREERLEAYATATSLDGTQRNPDSLSSQEAVSYQDEPSEGRQCSTCRYYIEDRNGDGVGACAIVAGEVAPEGYCVSYVEYEG